MNQLSATAMREPSVFIIDPKNLRRAGIVELLKSWADSVKVSLVDCPGIAPSYPADVSGCRMVILNLGEASISAPSGQRLIQNVRNQLATAPLVLISDREEFDEIVSAVRAGASGFIPTSIEPDIAVRALTFIMGGGSFFPPAALMDPWRGAKPWANDDDGPHLDDPGAPRGRRGPLNILKPGRSGLFNASSRSQGSTGRQHETYRRRPNAVRDRIPCTVSGPAIGPPPIPPITPARRPAPINTRT
jgi:DNA-binding NarL/FixJ family response regulator